MVAPVTGPVREVQDFLTFYQRREKYKQARPHSLVLPYLRLAGQRTLATGNEIQNFRPASYVEGNLNDVLSSRPYNWALMSAYEKFKSKLTDRAQMGENLVELGKSVSTVTNRMMQLFEFTRAVRRGHFGIAAEILRTPLPKRLGEKVKPKELSGQWLEYHLGIEPVIKDIGAALKLLSEPIKAVHISATNGSDTFSEPYKVFERRYAWSYAVGLERSTIKSLGVRYSASVAISNPNLYLANSLGLLNPVQVTWQAQPLSFVLDWFVNVEQFLGLATDFFGLTVEDATTTLRYRSEFYERWNNYGWEAKVDIFCLKRDTGIQLPSLGLRPFRGLSWQRGLTAAALLIPALKSLEPARSRRDPRLTRELFAWQRGLTKVIAPPYDWADEKRRRGY